MFKIVVAGMSHKTAPVEIRERISLPASDIARILDEQADNEKLATLAIISTCNRTEIYAATEDMGFNPHSLLDIIRPVRPSVDEVAEKHWYFLTGQDVVKHLFRVTAGLDSMMVGENQILAQVRDSYRIYSDTGNSHPLFNKLFHQSFSCGKRVRTETRLGEGAVSVAYAGVELASKIFGTLDDNTALLIGAGETGQLAARHMLKKNLQKLLITNRTLSRAVTAAEELGGDVVPFDEMGIAMRRADVVVLCTEAPHYIVTPEILTDVLSHRPSKPLFLIDLGMPRNCDPACAKLNNAFVYDIDALQKLADKNLDRRKNEVPLAEEIIEHMTNEFIKWFRSLRVEGTIRSLMVHNDKIRRHILEKNRNRFDESMMKDLDMLTKTVVKQIFHTPLEKLKEYDSNMKHGMTRLATIQELFDLKDDDENDNDQDRNAKE